MQETVFNEECLSKSFLSGCIPTVNCFPLDLVHIIDSMIWLNEKPVALLANVRPVSLLIQFCVVRQKSSHGDAFRMSYPQRYCL